jgi:hypothetical protein
MGWEKYLGRMAQQGKKFAPGFHPVKPHRTNLYTGLEMNRGLAIGITAGALAWGIGSSIASSEVNKGKNAALSNTEDVGSLGRMSGDAVGNVVGGRRNLGATGDMVFGMHNSRKGR